MLGALRRRLDARVADQAGFTLIEVLAALLLLSVGIFAVMSTFDFSRASTNQSELETAAVDRVQREVEAIRSLPYEQAAHPTGGILPASSDPKDPTSRISGSNFRWNRANASASEPLVIDAAGTVPMKQTIPRGDDDRFGYTIWRFVTQTQEPACASAVDCEDGGDQYRRVTVVVRADGLGGSLDPVWSSTTVIDPAMAANNDDVPETLCQSDDGTTLVRCSAGTSGELLYFLTNTSAGASNVRQQIPADPLQRKLHKTVRIPSSCTAGSATGCPVPDLMVGTGIPPLGADDPVPPLSSYATDVTPAVAVGRPIVQQDSGTCATTPTMGSDLKGAYWVSPALAEDHQLTGKGTLHLYTRTWSGTDAQVDLCGAVYSVPSNIANPVAAPPQEIGRFSGRYAWPAAPDAPLPGEPEPARLRPLSVDLRLGLTQLHTIPSGRRVGLRLWVANSSGDDIVLSYDHVDQQASLALRTEELHGN
jgi:prepilin-type N-terminal cleavage/methylation domain-containing protein